MPRTGLHVTFDSDPARLADRLVDALDPAGRPAFASDVVLVPTLGTGSWLMQRAARRHGVAGLIDVSLGGRYIWQALERVLEDMPGRSPFEAERARWVILSALDELDGHPECDGLRAQVESLGPSERFRLASAVARLFDRYLAFRRDWLDRWSKGGLVAGHDPAFMHEPWQRWLWHRLLERLPDVASRHPFDRFRDALARAREGGEDELARLARRLAPGRIFILGALSISPEQFRLLGEFGRLREIRWFAPDPSQDFWEDIVSPAEAGRLAQSDPTGAWLWHSEPAILGAWGKAQRDFLAQLRNLEGEAEITVDESFRDIPVAPARDALDALRKAVLQLDDGVWDTLSRTAPDPSIEIHAAHGEVRQAEILHDRLLDAFQELPGLTPGDIVVYCTDVERLAPALDAVFGAAPAGRRLPWRVAGRTGFADPAVRALERLLALAGGPREVAEVLALLDNPLVRACRNLAEADVRQLAGWLAGAGIRCDERDEPAARKHGWQAGVERLLLGMVADGTLHSIAGRQRAGGPRFGDSGALEALLDLLASIDGLAGQEPARPAGEWTRLLLDWCEAWLESAAHPAAGLARIREAVARVVESGEGLAAPMPLAVFGAALADELGAAASVPRAGGEITVCRLGALPGVPFRVTVMAGLDDGAWPTGAGRLEFDLLAAWPRFGDRQPRSGERGAFLDAVLATTDRLLCLYTGRDARDDGECIPSIQLRELLGYLARMGSPCARVFEHGLQPFGAHAFDGSAPGRSHAREWLAAARTIREPPGVRSGTGPVVVAGTVPADETGEAGETAWTLDELIRTLASPAQAFCAHALGIDGLRRAGRLQEPAPFDPGAHDRAAAQAVIEPVWRGELSPEALPELMVDAPWTPAGAGEAIALRQMDALLAAALAARARVLGHHGLPDGPGSSSVVDVRCMRGQVTGRLDGLHGKRVQLLMTTFGFNHRFRIEAWLRHVLWAATAGEGAQTILLAIEPGRCETWSACLDQTPEEALAHALAWCARIRTEPLALFPYALAGALKPGGKARDPDAGRRALLDALDKALRENRLWSSGSTEAQAGAILWRGAWPDSARILDDGMAAYEPILLATRAWAPEREQET